MELNVCGENVQVVDTIPNEMSVKEYISKKVTASGREDPEDPFYVVDLGRVIDLYQDWVAALPTVSPFYAVKANEDLALLKTLAALGTGFDCASKHEVQTILDLGVSPERIIYANPCKQISYLQYAAKKGVRLMTFDNELELHKIFKHFPTALLALRIKADAPDCVGKPGYKFGCTVLGGKALLDTAKKLGLNVVGVSFHVGSRCQTPSAYEVALEMAAELFQYGSVIGYSFNLLDMGGGFPGDKGSNEVFHKVASSINKTLKTHFSHETYPHLKIMAEPGRYFASSTHIIAVNIISKRSCDTEASGEGPKFMYYVNDGIYGSFNGLLYDQAIPAPKAVKVHSNGLSDHPSRVWGQTCAGTDKIGDALLPELDIGDWIYFDNMGAYTIASATCFNGFPKAIPYYYVTREKLEQFEKVHNLSSRGSPQK